MRGISPIVLLIAVVSATIAMITPHCGMALVVVEDSWGSGTHSNTTYSPYNMTLDIETPGTYYEHGGYISQTIDAGQVVEWGSINWSAQSDASHEVDVRVNPANLSSYEGWSDALTNGGDVNGMSRYVQLMVNLSTSDTGSAPNISNITMEYSLPSPVVTLNLPVNGQTSTAGIEINFSCSAAGVNNLSSISLYWNRTDPWHTNSSSVSGERAVSWFLYKDINASPYEWTCKATDDEGNEGWGANRTLFIENPVSDTTAPTLSFTKNGTYVVNGSHLNISPSASDDTAVDRVWMTVTLPSGSTEVFILNNNAGNTYPVMHAGRHTIEIFANDTSNNTANSSGYFISGEQLSLNITTSTYDGSGLSSSIAVLEPGSDTEVNSFTASDGTYEGLSLIGGDFDMGFVAYSGNLDVRLRGVELGSSLNEVMGMDKPPVPSGFALAYAFNSTYSFDSATIRFDYTSIEVPRDENVSVHKCDSWDFENRSCPGSWSSISANINRNSNYIIINTTSFSAFALRQDPYCGDGNCDSGETSATCLSDCTCTNGDTRTCSTTHTGRCGNGNETCINGAWVGCLQARVESCNQIDDDCDGLIDNVGGGNSEDTTQCACFGGASPTREIFDGVDNDCDGRVDEGCVCTDGDTQECGSDIGECSKGISTCQNCQWGPCDGNAGSTEICGNGKDDDCDGTEDENANPGDCISASNAICTQGMIPDTGCICGSSTYTTGYCCDGSYSSEACPGFPWWILLVVGAGLLIAALALYFLKERKTDDDEWGELEKKYTPARM